MSSSAHKKTVITKPRFSVTAGPMGHRFEHKQTVVEVGNCSHPSDRCDDNPLCTVRWCVRSAIIE